MDKNRSIIALYKTARELEHIVQTKDRRHLFKIYKKCFTGAAAVRALIRSGKCATRDSAVQMGTALLEAGYIKTVGEETEFKDDTSFYTFDLRKRMTRQEKESSIHRLAVSMTGGFVLNIEGDLLVKVAEESEKGLDLVKSPFRRLKKRTTQMSGGYVTVFDDEDNKLLVPLATVVEIDFPDFEANDFSFTCIEDGIRSTYFFRCERSADLWVRHLMVEILNAAQVIESSITLLMEQSHSEKFLPEKFEELISRAVVIWQVLDFPCRRQGIALRPAEAKTRLKNWIKLTEANGEMPGSLNDTVSPEQIRKFKLSLLKSEDEVWDMDKEVKDDEDDDFVFERPKSTPVGTITADDVTDTETIASRAQDPFQYSNPLEEIREHTEELLFRVMHDNSITNLGQTLEMELRLASVELRDERRYLNGKLGGDFEFQGKHVKGSRLSRNMARQSRGVRSTRVARLSRASKGSRGSRITSTFSPRFTQGARISMRSTRSAHSSAGARKRHLTRGSSMGVKEFRGYFKDVVSNEKEKEKA